MAPLFPRSRALLMALVAALTMVLAAPPASAEPAPGAADSRTTTTPTTAPATTSTPSVPESEATAAPEHGPEHGHEETSPAELGITSTEIGPAEADEVAGAVPFLGTHEVWCTQRNPDRYGICSNHHSYAAIDIGMPVGTTVNASGPGVVHEARRSDADARGLYVTVRHADGIYSRYLHLSSVSVSVGQTVATGTPLGRSGNTGSSTSPHLHYDEQRPLGTPKELGTMIGWVGTEQVRYPEAFGTTDWRRVAYGNLIRNDSFTSPVPPTPRQWGGPAVTTGDFDGDGFDDLAAGIPGKDSGRATNAGGVTVAYGSEAGATRVGSQQFVAGVGGVAGTSEAGDVFGAAVAAGDFDADGYDDLAVGVPREDVPGAADAGAVVVLYGSTEGLGAERSRQRWAGSGLAGRSAAGDQLGAALAAGDFDGDGYDDLAIGVPGDDTGATDAGAVVVARGGAAGLSGRGGRQLVSGVDGIAGRAKAGELFGAALAAGDLDGHGSVDLAVGAPGEDVGQSLNAGQVIVVGGGDDGLEPANSRQVRAGLQGITGRSERDDAFGAAVAIGDVDGDGVADLVVGAPGEDTSKVNDGAVAVVPGSPLGPTGERSRQYWSGSRDSVGTAADHDLLGAALALGDTDGDGRAEILVGVPGKDVGSARDAGAVLVLGTTPTVLQAGLAEVAGRARAESRFGRSVAAGDLNGDGLADAVVAAPTERARRADATGVITVVPGRSATAGGGESLRLVRGQNGLVGTAKVDDHFGGLLPPYLF